MADSTSQAPAFAVGDRVMIRRNLDHPAWMKKIDPDALGDTCYVRDPDVVEEIGQATIVNSDRRLYGFEVRATNGFWYDAATGSQVGSGATTISKINRDPKE